MYRDIRPDGEILESFGEGSTDYAYTGEMYDPNTGLVFLSARYYNPTDGRYMSKDQWYGFAKNSQSMNRWNYVGANPIMRTDATGRCYGPAEFLRNFEPGICQALDQSIFIYAYPNSTPEQVVAASFYISAWAVSHSALLVGAGALGAAKIASAGVSSYVLQLALTYPTVTNMLISSGVVLSSVDDLMVIYAGLTGDEEDQQRAAELAILASLDGSSPLADIFANTRFLASECIGTIERKLGRVKVGTAEEILSELATSGVFPSKYLRDAIGGFGNDTPVRRITLDKDIIVFQYRTRESDMTPWFTTTYYKGIDSSGSHYNAIRYLALPNRNDATGVYVYRIPAGQEIVIGKVTNQLGNPDFHSNAIGGGFQIYSPNMGAAKELKK